MALAYVLGAITFVVVLTVVAVIILGRVFHSGVSTGGRRAPLVSAKATIIGKRADEVHRGNSAMGTINTKYYYVTFDLDNGDTMELLTNKRLYNESNIGKVGTLSYKGSKFVAFK